MKKISLLFLLISLVLIGCTDYKAKVESDTKWSGTFGNQYIQGNGNQTIDLGDDEKECCQVNKLTKEGRLKVTIINDGFLGTDGASYETTSENGYVSVCTK